MVTDNDVARRSGRVTHQTSRRSFSSRLSSPLLSFLPLLSLFSLFPSPLFDSFLASLSFGLFLRIVPTGSSTFVNAHRRARGFNNTGNILDPDRNRTHRSKEFSREKKKKKKKDSILCSFFFIVSTFHPSNCFKNPIEIPLSFPQIIPSLPIETIHDLPSFIFDSI